MTREQVQKILEEHTPEFVNYQTSVGCSCGRLYKSFKRWAAHVAELICKKGEK